MSSVKRIVDWAATDLAEWEADIICRLLENIELSEDDLEQITSNVLNKFDLSGNLESCFKLAVVEDESTENETSSSPVTLCAIGSVENINAIHSSAILPFGHSGLTLIYGENGSGKSGYSRILKSACFAKYVEPDILKNIYKPSNGLQSAQISYIENDVRKIWNWSPGKTLSEPLKVNVYDTDCGKVLLEIMMSRTSQGGRKFLIKFLRSLTA